MFFPSAPRRGRLDRHNTPATRLRPAAAVTLIALAQLATPAGAQTRLGEISVEERQERADGPVQGYRATRSATFTKTDTPLKEVPAAISVVPASLMHDQAMRSMADALRYVPGATAHQGEGNRDQVVLRGNSTTADFYIDGVRDDAQIFRDLYNLERVEVLKGPGGMIFGRGGAGGLVNRVVKRPQFTSIGEVNLTVGSHSQKRVTADLGNKLGDAAAWRVNAMLEDADSFRNGADLKRYAVNPSVTLVPGSNTALTLAYERLHDERTADRGFPSRNGRPFDADPATFFGNAEQSQSRASVDGLSAVLDHDFGGGLQLRNTLRATHYDKFYQNIYPGSAVGANGTMSLSAYNNANLRTNVFNQTDLTYKFAAGGLLHTLLAGIELGRQNSANKRNTGFFGTATSITVPASAPLATATRFAATASDADNKVTADIAALYLQDQIELNREWKLLAGLRYDHFKVNFDDRRTVVPPVDLARTDNAVSPRLGLIWAPHAFGTYYVSYSYAFLPSGEQLGLATTTADLAPEKAKNLEIGARWNLRSNLELSAALFRLDKTDVRAADPTRPGFFVKTGKQRTDGLELGLQGEITRSWQVYAGYAWLDGRITQAMSSGTTASAATLLPAGRKIGLVPAQALSLWNKFELGGGWGAGLGVIHQAESYTSFNNTVKLPAFNRADAALYHAFADGKTRLALNVENLFDKKYFPTVDGDNNISPGAPRNAKLTLTVKF